MSRSFAIRFYTKHDIDLLTLYYRNVDVANVMHQVLVAFIKGENFSFPCQIHPKMIFNPKVRMARRWSIDCF